MSCCRDAGKDLSQQANHYDALSKFSAAISLYDSSGDFFSSRSLCYSKLGAHIEAVADAQKAVTLINGSEATTESYHLLALAWIALKDRVQAREAIVRGLDNCKSSKLLIELAEKLSLQDNNHQQHQGYHHSYY